MIKLSRCLTSHCPQRRERRDNELSSNIQTLCGDKYAVTRSSRFFETFLWISEFVTQFDLKEMPFYLPMCLFSTSSTNSSRGEPERLSSLHGKFPNLPREHFPIFVKPLINLSRKFFRKKNIQLGIKNCIFGGKNLATCKFL